MIKLNLNKSSAASSGRLCVLKRAAALIIAALLLAAVLLFTGCPHKPADNSGGGGSTGGGGGGSHPAVQKYAITFDVEGGNGTLKAKAGGVQISSGDKVEQGKTVTFTAIPLANHKVKMWKLDGALIAGNTSSYYTHTVTKAADIKVSFEALPAGQASYTVLHYQERTVGGYPEEPEDTETLHGAAGANAAYTPKTYEGFTYKPALTVQTSSTIQADSSTVIKLYYERKTVNVTFKLAGGNVGGNTSDIVKTGKYGTALIVSEPVKTGATFNGWEPALPSQALFPAADMTYTAQWQASYSGVVSIKYDSSTIKVFAKNSADKWQVIPSGSEIAAGKKLLFGAVNLPSGQQVDKWKVNTKELNGNIYTVNAGDAADEGGQKVITVTYTTKPAEPITVRFDESKIQIDKGDHISVHNGDTVYEGDWLLLRATNIPPGHLVDKWKINTIESYSGEYKVNAADAIDEGGQKVIEITYTTKPAVSVTVRFNESEIEVRNGAAPYPMHTETIVPERSRLSFIAKNLPAGLQVDKWKVNAKELKYPWYMVNALDAIDEGGQKIIRVTYTTRPAVPVTVLFDESTIRVYNSTSHNEIHNGDAVYKGDILSFAAISIPEGQQIDKWKVNTKVLERSGYEVDAGDAIDEGGQKVITVTYTTKPAEPITVRFDESKIQIDKGDHISVHNGDTVYEGDWLLLRATNIPPGHLVDKWKINTIESYSGEYKVNAADAIDEGGQKVIEITYTTKPAVSVTVRFNESEIEVRNGAAPYPMHTETIVPERSRLSFIAKNLPAGLQVDKWKVNAKELKYPWYMVNALDAIDEGGQKIIRVTYTTRPAVPVTVLFDESTIRVYNSTSHNEIHNGDAVYKGDILSFAAISIPEGQQIDKWKVNTKVLERSGYEVDAGDAIDEGGQKVIRVTYTTKPGINPIIVKFDPTLVHVFDRMSSMGLQSGQTVYEGAKLNFRIHSSISGTINKWFVNAKGLENYQPYTVNPSDAVYENGQKVIRIRFTVENPKTLTVQFNSSEVECKVFDGTAATPVSSGYQGPAYTYVILKAIIPSGKQVKYWKVNGNIIYTSTGAAWLEGQANPAFATPEGLINISVIFE